MGSLVGPFECESDSSFRGIFRTISALAPNFPIDPLVGKTEMWAPWRRDCESDSSFLALLRGGPRR